jgi:hypothetical protein
MVVVRRDFPELVGRAEQIFAGTVTDVRDSRDETGTPYTYVTFGDLTVVKGDVGTSFTLRLYGGGAGDVGVYVPDMPAFTVGERAVLFVAGNGRAVCPLVGVWQGRFHVRRDEARGMDVVEDSDSRRVVGRTGRDLRRVERGTTAETPLALGQFLELVSDEMDRPTATPVPGVTP